MIGAAAPVLDAILAVGERISRITEPVDYEYYPVHDEATEADSTTNQSESPRPGSPESDGAGPRDGSAR